MKFQRAAQITRVPPDLLYKYMALRLLLPLHSWHCYIQTESNTARWQLCARGISGKRLFEGNGRDTRWIVSDFVRALNEASWHSGHFHFGFRIWSAPHSKHRHGLPICLRKYKEQIKLSLSLGDWVRACNSFGIHACQSRPLKRGTNMDLEPKLDPSMHQHFYDPEKRFMQTVF
jgi:hypothetical protein